MMPTIGAGFLRMYLISTKITLGKQDRIELFLLVLLQVSIENILATWSILVLKKTIIPNK